MVKPNGVINNLQLKSYKPGDLFWLEFDMHFLMNQSFCDFVKVKHTTSGRLFAPWIGITFVDLKGKNKTRNNLLGDLFMI